MAFHDPAGARYGLPTYLWRCAPEGLVTRRQLMELGLRPGGQPIAGQVMWRGRGGVRVAYLYRLDLAKPKRAASAAQLVALDAAMAARRTCSSCGQLRPYCIPRSLGECGPCAAGRVAA
jgi:hypothetical protein